MDRYSIHTHPHTHTFPLFISESQKDFEKTSIESITPKYDAFNGCVKGNN